MNNEEKTIRPEGPQEGDARETAAPAAPRPDDRGEPKAASKPKAERPAEQPVRRVGTLTMGFALIVTGIVALLAMFYPTLDLTLAYKLSPLIFILLGVEILYNYFAHRGQKLKYDLLSGFVCFVLIVAGGCLAAVPAAWNYFGPPAMQARDEINTQLRGRISDSLLDERPLIGQMFLNTELPYYKQYTPDMGYEELSGDARLYLHFNLNGPYGDEKSFVEDCRKILLKLDALSLDIRNLSLNYDGKEADFSLDLYDRYQLDLSTDELLRRVDADWHEEDDEFSEDALPTADALFDGEASSPVDLSEWPGRVTYSSDGMTAHSFYFDLPVSGPTTLQVDVTTDRGTLDMQITGPDGTVYFEGYDLSEGDGPHTFSLPVPGSYQVKLTADAHSGTFVIQDLG